MASRTSYVSSKVYRLIVSKVCSRSHGQPPGARSRAIIATARSKRSPVDEDIGNNLNDLSSREQTNVREFETHFDELTTSALAYSPQPRISRVERCTPIDGDDLIPRTGEFCPKCHCL